ncbi:MAG: acetylglutamate kinase [Bacteroidales bacterium]|nr:acetylglutamate kinase [Bacteroidales bacterium]
MIREGLNIIKVGGAIVEDEESLKGLLMSFSGLRGKKILVHGGGKIATEIASRLGVETQMIDGRRITSAEMLKVVTMVYGGLVNKDIVARLQALGENAIGLTGADMNLIMSVKRPVELVNFGYVGDVKYVNTRSLKSILEAGAVPVLAPLTHDKEGTMLNTNADTIASSVARALAGDYSVTLTFCSSTPGVLRNLEDPTTLVKTISKTDFDSMVSDGTISEGMIPKLQNAFEAINDGVSKVVITSPSDLSGGTTILADPETDD